METHKKRRDTETSRSIPLTNKDILKKISYLNNNEIHTVHDYVFFNQSFIHFFFVQVLSLTKL